MTQRTRRWGLLTSIYVALGGPRFLLGVLAASLAVVLLLLWIVSGVTSNYSQQVVLGVSSGSLFGIMALALVLIYKSTEVINFSQGEMAMFSTYIAWALLQQFGESRAAVWLVLLLTMLIAFAMGALMEVLVIRRVRHAPVLNAVIITLGFFTIYNSLASWTWGNIPKPFPTPFSSDTVSVAHVTISYHTLGIMGLSLLLASVLYLLFQFTRLGLAMRATAEDLDTSRLMGVPVNLMLTLGWGLSAGVGAVAGVLVAHTLTLSPLLMFNLLIFAFAGAVIGGLDSPGGALLGGILVGVAQNVLGITDFLGGSQLRVAWAFAFILLVLLFLPSGLFGHRRLRRV